MTGHGVLSCRYPKGLSCLDVSCAEETAYRYTTDVGLDAAPGGASGALVLVTVTLAAASVVERSRSRVAVTWADGAGTRELLGRSEPDAGHREVEPEVVCGMRGVGVADDGRDDKRRKLTTSRNDSGTRGSRSDTSLTRLDAIVGGKDGGRAKEAIRSAKVERRSDSGPDVRANPGDRRDVVVDGEAESPHGAGKGVFGGRDFGGDDGFGSENDVLEAFVAAEVHELEFVVQELRVPVRVVDTLFFSFDRGVNVERVHFEVLERLFDDVEGARFVGRWFVFFDIAEQGVDLANAVGFASVGVDVHGGVISGDLDCWCVVLENAKHVSGLVGVDAVRVALVGTRVKPCPSVEEDQAKARSKLVLGGELHWVGGEVAEKVERDIGHAVSDEVLEAGLAKKGLIEGQIPEGDAETLAGLDGGAGKDVVEPLQERVAQDKVFLSGDDASDIGGLVSVPVVQICLEGRES